MKVIIELTPNEFKTGIKSGALQGIAECAETNTNATTSILGIQQPIQQAVPVQSINSQQQLVQQATTQQYMQTQPQIQQQQQLMQQTVPVQSQQLAQQQSQVINQLPIHQPVPTTQQTYSMDQLALAGTQLVDAGHIGELQQLLTTFGVQALTQLPKEQYGAFATQLRALGAKI